MEREAIVFYIPIFETCKYNAVLYLTTKILSKFISGFRVFPFTVLHSVSVKSV